MKRKKGFGIAVLGSIVLLVALWTWAVSPCVGPILGTRRTAQELLEFIDSHNAFTIVSPVGVIDAPKGSYHDWAYAEFEARRKIVAVLAVVICASLVLYAVKCSTMKTAG